MFNNFFNTENEASDKTSQPNQQDQVTASITYYYDAEDKDIKIDVAVKDYCEETIDDLCNILEVLCDNRAYIETVNIIRSNLSKEHKGSLTRFLVNIAKQSDQNILKKMEDIIKNQPCISPSDMLK